jgi:hypothetical protein
MYTEFLLERCRHRCEGNIVTDLKDSVRRAWFGFIWLNIGTVGGLWRTQW